MVAVEHCFAQCMVPGTLVLTYEPCLAFLHTSSGSFLSGSPRSDGSSRPLVRRLEKSGEQASHEPRSWGRSCGVRAGSSILGQAFRLERLLGDGWCLKRVLRSERWAEEADKRAPVLMGRPSGRRPDCGAVYVEPSSGKEELTPARNSRPKKTYHNERTRAPVARGGGGAQGKMELALAD